MTGQCHAQWHARRLWRTYGARYFCAIFTLYGSLFSPGRAGTAAFRFDVHVVWQRTERAVRLPVELIQRHEGFRGFASGPAECEGGRACWHLRE